MARAKALGELLAREEGKTLAEGTGEVMRAARIFKYFAGEALRRHGQTLESTRPGIDVSTRREAVGVFGLITPWNFPIAIPAWKSAPALAFGNTRGAEAGQSTPAIAHALAAIIHECGAPAGVFNLVLGAGGVGAAIVDHPGVDGISFTGSQAVGAKVGAGAMARQARVQLEMGGKNPLVVLDDADLDRAVAIALDGAFFADRPALHRVEPHHRAGRHSRPLRRGARRRGPLRSRSATRSIPRPRSARRSSETQLEQNLRYVDIATDEGGRLVDRRRGGSRRDSPATT